MVCVIKNGESVISETLYIMGGGVEMAFIDFLGMRGGGSQNYKKCNKITFRT